MAAGAAGADPGRRIAGGRARLRQVAVVLVLGLRGGFGGAGLVGLVSSALGGEVGCGLRAGLSIR